MCYGLYFIKFRLKNFCFIFMIKQSHLIIFFYQIILIRPSIKVIYYVLKIIIFKRYNDVTFIISYPKLTLIGSIKMVIPNIILVFIIFREYRLIGFINVGSIIIFCSEKILHFPNGFYVFILTWYQRFILCIDNAHFPIFYYENSRTTIVVVRSVNRIMFKWHFYIAIIIIQTILVIFLG